MRALLDLVPWLQVSAAIAGAIFGAVSVFLALRRDRARLRQELIGALSSELEQKLRGLERRLELRMPVPDGGQRLAFDGGMLWENRVPLQRYRPAANMEALGTLWASPDPADTLRLAKLGAALKLRQTGAVADPALKGVVGLQPGAGTSSTEEVVCSVFAPPEIAAGEIISVQAFLHLKEQLLRVARTATTQDPTANRRGSATLTTRVERGSMVDLYLDCPALLIEAPAFRRVKWTGDDTAQAIFRATVSRQTSGSTIEGTLFIGLDGIPVGEIAFSLALQQQLLKPASLMSSLPSESGIESVGSSALRYQRAFISYSRKDFRDVSLFAQGLGEKGIKPTVDVSSLEPGDDWQARLPEFVEAAEVFYLMWSDSAAASRYVDWEVRHAVELHGASKRPRIKPIPLQLPWPEPPEYLRPFHFYSEWQGHRAAHMIGLTKPTDVQA